jgi:3-oxoacyl-[acyl-carrier protein] reductase
MNREMNIRVVLFSGALLFVAWLVARFIRTARYSLHAKVVLITGGSRGLGLVLARHVCARAGSVALIARDPEELARAKADLYPLGGKVLTIECDLLDVGQIQSAVRQIIDRFGKIDILINNAGMTRDGLAMRMSLEDWDSVINTNLRGAFSFTQAVLRAMVKRRSGRIINISSVSGIMGNAGQTNYAASRAGLIGFTKSLARELAGRNITVNAVAPGFITTDMTAGLSDKVKETLHAKIPLGKTGTPEDIANAVAFLASAEAGYITGQTLCVDGGIVM